MKKITLIACLFICGGANAQKIDTHLLCDSVLEYNDLVYRGKFRVEKHNNDTFYIKDTLHKNAGVCICLISDYPIDVSGKLYTYKWIDEQHNIKKVYFSKGGDTLTTLQDYIQVNSQYQGRAYKPATLEGVIQK